MVAIVIVLITSATTSKIIGAPAVSTIQIDKESIKLPHQFNAILVDWLDEPHMLYKKSQILCHVRSFELYFYPEVVSKYN